MARLTDELMEFMENNPAELATADKDGVPHVAPKGSVVVVDEDTIAYAEMYPEGRSAQNVRETGKAAVSIVDYPNQKAYMIRGDAELKDEGDSYKKIVEVIEQLPVDLPTPKYAGIIRIKEVINHSVGPEAGEKI
ncbi:pyridoxamine 5'-phosphate oxidase family protein [Methanonatronarchaeum sp. AMET6-2]|uniref:pyridoxamine 5'-phosphate oxidase family protein n=1 Tax=Methanonatronarchaeum sp. AMET6-2 TaxID=2933293 RepID=UPI001FF21BA5|nr:pyridoxamine 5'-phosphate oxidase family protein [Methanonatronarchaeum sp. AMET6-2]UOY09377.1 pyridoxamine 5'-phosphate oxidase family protein [Methanonatronarchaeum sp. AMET6-2]